MVPALGFAFVWHPRGDVFVHHRALCESERWPLAVGDVVRCVLRAGPKGLCATAVERHAVAERTPEAAPQPSANVTPPAASEDVLDTEPVPTAARSEPSPVLPLFS